ncbi:hypothetical protein [Ruminococcus sp. HUN007]|uniref:hypothetical protein n=1 Tax=Ruminococcus sp. HUN007 TaxID=1514668 RepID=UPI0005D2A930|nr:hypothetical protein [Ruminococcus sp. HUN007]
MKKTRRNALLSAVLCLSASCLMPFGTPPEKADAAATVTIGYYTEVPEFQSGSSDEEKKKRICIRVLPDTVQLHGLEL